MTRSIETQIASTFTTLFVLLALLLAPTLAFAMQKCDPNPQRVPSLECVDGYDTDSDGVCDYEDNCETIWNPKQIDVDSDERGNACDCDYNGDSVVGGPDFIIFLAAYNSTFPNASYNPVVDHDCDNDVDSDDFDLFVATFTTVLSE
jgi:hypothetical protein